MVEKGGKVKSKSGGENSEISSSKNFEKNSGKISQFFNHLVAYGGFNVQDGVMYVWGDPSIFMPMPAFAELFHSVEKLRGNEAHEIFYWLGRLYGKNSTLMLANRFGIDKKDIPEFINGATQDGMGLVYLKQENVFKDGTIQGIIEGSNSVFAEQYIKEYGKQKNPIDYYLLGILSGGGEPLYNTQIIGKEVACVSKGDANCVYDLRSAKSLPEFIFFKKIKLDEKELLEKTRMLTLKRKTDFKFFGKKDIQFGDGSFKLKSVAGINMPVYGLVIFNKILEQLDKKSKEDIERAMAKKFISSVGSVAIQKDLKSILSSLEIFGYGRFDIKVSGQNKTIVTNENNPYASDYLQLFGRTKETLDKFVCYLIEEVFKINKRNCSVKETSCRAKGDKLCTFELTFS